MIGSAQATSVADLDEPTKPVVPGRNDRPPVGGPRSLPPAPERSIGFVFGGRDARLLIVTVFAILGRPSVALATVAITSGVSLAIRLYLTRRAIRR